MRKTLRYILLSFAILFALEIVRGTIDIILLRSWPSKSTPSKFPVVRGAIHVHSNYSDGSGSIAEIIEAAQQSGLDFIILADHNNIQAKLDSAERFWGQTLLIVGEEISTNTGHLLSIGAHRSHYAPELNDIPRLIQEIHSDSGLAFIAHPDHPRIRWKSTEFFGADGMEIINADSEWRNDSPREVIDALIAELVGLPGMNYLLDTPAQNMQRWDEELRSRRLLGIGSVDAHARIKLGGEKYIGFPSYQKMFDLMSTFIIIDQKLSTDPSLARTQVLNALRRGRVFFALQSIGDATGFEFYGEQNGGIMLPQDTLFYREDSASVLRVIVPMEKNIVVQLYRDGEKMQTADSQDSRFEIRGPGIYRIVVFQERIQFPWFSRRLMPWIFSNPVFVVSR